MRLVRPPAIAKALLPGLHWRMPADERAVYLTFDDGPEPRITPWVLEQLDAHGAKATFFLIGRNAGVHPGLVESIRAMGHAVGNHTWDHRNGWRTSLPDYRRSIDAAQPHIGTRLFRPPYGRITRAQARAIGGLFDIVMWDVLSHDFDPALDGRRCAGMVMRNARPGSIIVFHDSAKAEPRLRIALPLVLNWLVAEGYRLLPLPQGGITAR